MASAEEMALLRATVHLALPDGLAAERVQAHIGPDEELLRLALRMLVKCDLVNVDPEALWAALKPGYNGSTPAELYRWILERGRRQREAWIHQQTQGGE